MSADVAAKNAASAATKSTPDVVIETRNLTKVYRDFWGRQKVRALKALDLEVRRGEIFGLLGPNGSGKSTTIKLLLGLLFPTSGRALVFDKDATDVRARTSASATFPKNLTCTSSSTPKRRSTSTAACSTCLRLSDGSVSTS